MANPRRLEAQASIRVDSRVRALSLLAAILRLRAANLITNTFFEMTTKRIATTRSAKGAIIAHRFSSDDAAPGTSVVGKPAFGSSGRRPQAEMAAAQAPPRCQPGFCNQYFR